MKTAEKKVGKSPLYTNVREQITTLRSCSIGINPFPVGWGFLCSIGEKTFFGWFG